MYTATPQDGPCCVNGTRVGCPLLLPGSPAVIIVLESRGGTPLDIEIRPIAPEEYGDFASAAESAFGHVPRPEELNLYRKVFEFDRSLAAFEAGTIVATAGAES